jgi:hypothetical protein
VRSNAPAIERLALERHGTAGDAPPACAIAITLRDVDIPGPDEVSWHIGEGTIQLSARGLSARVDLERGAASVDVNESFMLQRAVFQRCVLEGIPYTLLTHRDRHPVHASAIRSGNTALLLRGPSGVGKSTLAYEAHRQGLAVLSDDVCRVQLRAEPSVWGDTPRPIVRLLDDARRRFPELAEVPAVWMSGGGIVKLEVPLSDAHRPFVRAARVCLLRRGTGATVRITPASAEEIHDDLMNAPESQLDLHPTQRAQVARFLSAAGGWHMELSSDPADAVRYLRELLAEVRG